MLLSNSTSPDNIAISSEEKNIIRQYFINRFDPDLTKVPDGTKLSRIQWRCRVWTIPASDPNYFIQQEQSLLNEENVSWTEEEEKITHSAVCVKGNLIYLQNKLDATASIDLNSHQYFANGDKKANKAKVKIGIDDENRIYFYKTFALATFYNNTLPSYNDKSDINPELFLYSYERAILNVEDEEEDTEYYSEDEENTNSEWASKKLEKAGIESLQRAKAISLNKSLGETPPQKTREEFLFVRRKQVEILYDVGPTLVDFLNENHSLSLVEKNQITYAFLKELQIRHAKGVVHSDLKPTNICIRKTDKSQYKITIIDWSESFNIATPPQRICGTLGYTAPEFLQNPSPSLFTIDELISFSTEQETYHQDNPVNQSLKTQEYQQKYKNYIKPISALSDEIFTDKLDSFAAGCIILRDLNLPPESPFGKLALNMVSGDPHKRLSTSQIDLENIFSKSKVSQTSNILSSARNSTVLSTTSNNNTSILRAEVPSKPEILDEEKQTTHTIK